MLRYASGYVGMKLLIDKQFSKANGSLAWPGKVKRCGGRALAVCSTDSSGG